MPEGQRIPCPGLQGARLPGCERAHGCIVWRKWCSASLCLAELLGNEAWQRREERSVSAGQAWPSCSYATRADGQVMQDRLYILLTCHAAATLSFARSGQLSFYPSSLPPNTYIAPIPQRQYAKCPEPNQLPLIIMANDKKLKQICVCNLKSNYDKITIQ